MTEFARAYHALPPPSTSRPWREFHVRLAVAAAEHPDADADELLDAALDDLPDHLAAHVRSTVCAAQCGITEEQLLVRARMRAAPVAVGHRDASTGRVTRATGGRPNNHRRGAS
jgi:hypothetical protein